MNQPQKDIYNSHKCAKNEEQKKKTFGEIGCLPKVLSKETQKDKKAGREEVVI